MYFSLRPMSANENEWSSVQYINWRCTIKAVRYYHEGRDWMPVMMINHFNNVDMAKTTKRRRREKKTWIPNDRSNWRLMTSLLGVQLSHLRTSTFYFCIAWSDKLWYCRANKPSFVRTIIHYICNPSNSRKAVVNYTALFLGRPFTVVTGGLIKCSWCFFFFNA